MTELGLTRRDEVHRVVITGDEVEHAEPAMIEIRADAWVDFFTGDWRVHEVRFEADSLSEEALDFLTASDQMESPPLLHAGSRFLVSFGGAPAGRYPYVLEGNAAASRGVVVVLSEEDR